MFWIWTGFILFILALLALDLGVFNRKPHVVSVKEALIWSGVWIAMGLLFSVFIYFAYDGHWLELGRTADGSVRGPVTEPFATALVGVSLRAVGGTVTSTARSSSPFPETCTMSVLTADSPLRPGRSVPTTR